jgi:RNA polymerase sigma-70 factor (ECF subfamily)
MDKQQFIKQKELIKRCISGDELAARIIFDQNYGLVYSVASKILKNHEEAEDLAQEVFERVYNKLDCFNAEVPLASWIRKIAYHRSLDKLKKRKLEVVELNEQELASKESGVETKLDGKDIVQNLDEALNNLKPKERALVTIAAEHDSDYTQLTTIFGLTKNEIRGRLYRVRQKLRRLMA